MVKGSYDLQALRMQAGLRLCANFRAKLKSETEETELDDLPTDDLSPEALNVIKTLKDSYRRLTDGVAKNRTIPKEQGFKGDEVISSFTEIVLVDQYLALEKQETRQFGQLIHTLEHIPIYMEY